MDWLIHKLKKGGEALSDVQVGRYHKLPSEELLEDSRIHIAQVCNAGEEFRNRRSISTDSTDNNVEGITSLKIEILVLSPPFTAYRT